MRLERVDLLRPRIPELLAATFKDPDEGVRKYAERALQHTLHEARPRTDADNRRPFAGGPVGQ